MSVVFFSVKVASKNNTTVEQELAPLAQRASECLDRLYPSGRLAEVRVIFFCMSTVQKLLKNELETRIIYDHIISKYQFGCLGFFFFGHMVIKDI